MKKNPNYRSVITYTEHKGFHYWTQKLFYQISIEVINWMYVISSTFLCIPIENYGKNIKRPRKYQIKNAFSLKYPRDFVFVFLLILYSLHNYSLFFYLFADLSVFFTLFIYLFKFQLNLRQLWIYCFMVTDSFQSKWTYFIWMLNLFFIWANIRKINSFGFAFFCRVHFDFKGNQTTNKLNFLLRQSIAMQSHYASIWFYYLFIKHKSNSIMFHYNDDDDVLIIR